MSHHGIFERQGQAARTKTWPVSSPGTGWVSTKNNTKKAGKVKEVQIDVNALESDLMRGTMKLDDPSMSLICRVPDILRRHNSRAYTPNAFSIGPFHYHKQHLKATEKIKLQYLKSLIDRLYNSTNSNSKAKVVRDLIESVRNVGQEAREFYEGDIGMSMDNFVKVLVLDGCFLIELFRRHMKSKLREKDDPVFTVGCMFQFIQHDLILLENQIPWLVLDLLFNMTMEDAESLKSLVLPFFSNIYSLKTNLLLSNEHADSVKKLECNHILHLLGSSMYSTCDVVSNKNISNERTNWMDNWKPMPTATILHEAGIKFEKDESTKSILDIKFDRHGGVLKIPPLLIDEITEPLLRNLIAYEQCAPSFQSVFTSYAMLMDNLINTAEDIKILCDGDVMDNWLNPEDGIELFNKIYIDACIKDFYYCDLTEAVNKYCKRRWPRNRALLKHNYFKTPCATISFLAAVTLLLLTLVQTVFTIIKYSCSPSPIKRYGRSISRIKVEKSIKIDLRHRCGDNLKFYNEDGLEEIQECHV
ncbi:hypothetical protein G4B88_027192 [Cannabis sativa]|uniref:Uncharacterized protein n=1 Tax=Cannabis sativa TaxID=3483 RepID=A0A7J6HQ94_CANSA|nr:hypothetical protein G4B88_027192 [Cannabis sativa]